MIGKVVMIATVQGGERAMTMSPLGQLQQGPKLGSVCLQGTAQEGLAFGPDRDSEH